MLIWLGHAHRTEANARAAQLCAAQEQAWCAGGAAQAARTLHPLNGNLTLGAGAGGLAAQQRDIRLAALDPVPSPHVGPGGHHAPTPQGNGQGARQGPGSGSGKRRASRPRGVRRGPRAPQAPSPVAA